MNKSRFFQVLALSVVTSLVAHADEGVLTKAMQDGPSGKSTPKTVTKNEDFIGNKVDSHTNGIEFRIGPIFNVDNSSVVIQTGPRGQGFNTKKLGLDDPNFGVKADLDWDLGHRLHFNNALTWIKFRQIGTLNDNVTFGTGMKLRRDSRVKADMDIVLYEPKFGYDVIKTDTYRFMPYVGAIAGVATGSMSALSGSVRREDNKLSVIDKPKVYDETEFFGTYVIGFENQVHFTRDFYAGVDVGGYYMDFLNGAQGKGYLAYDFNERLLLRVGCDVDWVSYDDRHVTAEGYSLNPFIQVGVKF